DEFWRAGFDDKSSDGISVPEPIGVIPKLQMWFQRKIPGATATELLLQPDATLLAGRIAEAIFKVHQAKVATERTHTLADELAILKTCLGKVQETEPQWDSRLGKILQACDALAATHPDLPKCGSHRDFYPAQVLSDGARIYLIDFDLYCSGDVGLDVGNFLGHLTEQSLRTFGNASALAEVERALENRFVELSGETSRASVKIYATLTLVRHIFLSTQYPDRRKTTEALIKLCEEKLGIN
ncbi:MAG: phosphotransferase, partial [Verrucomicrobiota bacterium]